MKRRAALLAVAVLVALALRRVVALERSGRSLTADVAAGEMARAGFLAAVVVVAAELAGIPWPLTVAALLFWLWYSGLLSFALAELGLDIGGGPGGTGADAYLDATLYY